jgi:transcriptional regulator with XRE-family HTH domain
MLAKERNVPARWRVFGRRLQELRKESKLSQAELGAEFDMTDVQISRLENGKSGTGFETVQAFERRLGARAGELIGIAFPSTSEPEPPSLRLAQQIEAYLLQAPPSRRPAIEAAVVSVVRAMVAA